MDVKLSITVGRMSKICYWGFLLGMLNVSTTFSQKRIPLTRAALDSLMSPRLLDGGEKLLAFDSYRKNLGTLLESDTARVVDFEFQNRSGKAIEITEIRSFCKCTVAYCDKEVVPSEGKGKVVVSYNPKNHSGTIDESVYVYTTESEHFPVARLSIEGLVEETDHWKHLPYKMGTLRLKRKSIMFQEQYRGYNSIERVLCANTGTGPIRVSAKMMPEFAQFHVEPEVLLPGHEGDIVIAIDGSKLPLWQDFICFQFELVADGDVLEKQMMEVKINVLNDKR